MLHSWRRAGATTAHDSATILANDQTGEAMLEAQVLHSTALMNSRRAPFSEVQIPKCYSTAKCAHFLLILPKLGNC